MLVRQRVIIIGNCLQLWSFFIVIRLYSLGKKVLWRKPSIVVSEDGYRGFEFVTLMTSIISIKYLTSIKGIGYNWLRQTFEINSCHCFFINSCHWIITFKYMFWVNLENKYCMWCVTRINSWVFSVSDLSKWHHLSRKIISFLYADDLFVMFFQEKDVKEIGKISNGGFMIILK